MGSIFGRPKVPEPKPVRMPDANDPAIGAAQDRKRREIAARSGRASTMLSNRQSGTPGTMAYTNSLLGQST